MWWSLGYGSILCFIFISWWVGDRFYPFLKKIRASDVPRGSVQVLFGHQKQRSPGKFNFSSMKFVHSHQWKVIHLWFTHHISWIFCMALMQKWITVKLQWITFHGWNKIYIVFLDEFLFDIFRFHEYSTMDFWKFH
jgi:hypothetical protein